MTPRRVNRKKGDFVTASWGQALSRQKKPHNNVHTVILSSNEKLNSNTVQIPIMWFRRIPFTKILKSRCHYIYVTSFLPLAIRLSPLSGAWNHRGVSRKKKRPSQTHDELSYCCNLRVLRVKEALAAFSPREKFPRHCIVAIRKPWIVEKEWLGYMNVRDTRYMNVRCIFCYTVTLTLFEAFINEAVPFQCHLAGF